MRVGAEVAHSALRLTAGVLRARSRPPRRTFVVVPLDLHDTQGLVPASARAGGGWPCTSG
jgi:multicomponent K+:H+ antiporter subunit E